MSDVDTSREAVERLAQESDRSAEMWRLELAKGYNVASIIDSEELLAATLRALLARAEAAEAERDALRAERDEARLLAGLGCDANGGGEHSVITQGTYRFCHKCGHTITQPDLRERCRKAEAERDALRAQVEEAQASAIAIVGEMKERVEALTAALATARREGAAEMREKAAQAISNLSTDDYYSTGERHAAEEMQGFSAFTIRNLPLPGDEA